VLDCLVRSLWL